MSNISILSFKDLNDPAKMREVWEARFKEDPACIDAIPARYRTKEMYGQVFYDGIKGIDFIPHEFQTPDMCARAFRANINSIRHIADRYKTPDMCAQAFGANKKNIKYIPACHVTGEMVAQLDFKDIRYIPFQFQTPDMCAQAFQKSRKNIRYIADSYKTLDMCISAYTEYYKDSKFDCMQYVPARFKKQTYMAGMVIDLELGSKNMPRELWDEEVCAAVVQEFKKLQSSGKKIGCSSELCLFVSRLYPQYADVINKDEMQCIIDDLYQIALTNSGTIEAIAKRRGVSVSRVNALLEGLAQTDNEIYSKIKFILSDNQQGFFFDMMSDVDTLIYIIDLLGIVSESGKIVSAELSDDQKNQFVYLMGKYLHHDLEKIYNFNFEKYKKNTELLSQFFTRVLKYRALNSDCLLDSEKATLRINNCWLNKYSRDLFFGIKNGVATRTYKYGPHSIELTFDVERQIVEKLKENGVPLYERLVSKAFISYFAGTLEEYLAGFAEYDKLYENGKPASGR